MVIRSGACAIAVAAHEIPQEVGDVAILLAAGYSRRRALLLNVLSGASGIAIRVANIQELLPKMQAAGIRVISKDGALVEWDAKIRNVFVKDPNGFLVELVGTVAPPAK